MKRFFPPTQPVFSFGGRVPPEMSRLHEVNPESHLKNIQTYLSLKTY